MYKQDLKQLVCQEIDKLEPVLSKLADYLHQHPEISMQEIKSGKLSQKTFRRISIYIHAYSQRHIFYCFYCH